MKNWKSRIGKARQPRFARMSGEVFWKWTKTFQNSFFQWKGVSKIMQAFSVPMLWLQKTILIATGPWQPFWNRQRQPKKLETLSVPRNFTKKRLIRFRTTRRKLISNRICGSSFLKKDSKRIWRMKIGPPSPFRFGRMLKKDTVNWTRDSSLTWKQRRPNPRIGRGCFLLMPYSGINTRSAQWRRGLWCVRLRRPEKWAIKNLKKHFTSRCWPSNRQVSRNKFSSSRFDVFSQIVNSPKKSRLLIGPGLPFRFVRKLRMEKENSMVSYSKSYSMRKKGRKIGPVFWMPMNWKDKRILILQNPWPIWCCRQKLQNASNNLKNPGHFMKKRSRFLQKI